MAAAILTAALLVASPPPDDWTMCATTGPRVVRHDAIDAVLAYRGWQRIPGVAYIATNNCADLGEWRALVVAGQVRLVMVADCAAAEDVPYRKRMGYVADVGRALWEEMDLPYCPVSGQVLTIDELFSPWRRQ